MEVPVWWLASLAYIATFLVGLHYVCQVLVLVAAPFEVRSQRRRIPRAARRVAGETNLLPSISVVIPAYNEQASILRTVRSALAVDYPRLEILVVNDGSTDLTLDVLWCAFGLTPQNAQPDAAISTQASRAVFVSRADPRLRVIDKRNGGKADALNTGINWSRHELVCAIDADVVLEPRALVELALPFLCQPSVVATSGMIRLLNGCRLVNGRVVPGLPTSALECIQVVEYLRAFNVTRLAFNRLNAHLIISGALGLFRRSLLVEVGGYQVQAIGEDMELVVRLHRHLRGRAEDGHMVFVADALAFTEAPVQLSDLGRQRTRWHLGLLTTLRLHRGMLGRRQYRAVGLLSFPYFVFFELLAPVAELLAWFGLLAGAAAGAIAWDRLPSLLLVLLILPTVVNGMAVVLDAVLWDFHRGFRARLKLLSYAFLEQLGYHQALLFYRLRAFFIYYRSYHVRGGWQPPPRQAGLAEGKD